MAVNSPRNSKKCELVSNGIINHIEYFFFRLGQTIAQHPVRTILICIGIVLLSLFGFFRFRQEKDPLKLWVPANSEFLLDTDWLINTFQRAPRLEIILTEAEDVLTPKVLQDMNVIYGKIVNTGEESAVKWSDICLKVPMVSPTISSVMNPNKKLTFDPSISLPSAMYCFMVNSLKKGCLQQNILELWKHDDKTLESITKQDIVDELSNTKISPVTGHLVNYEKLLGGIVRNSTGHIISAKSLLSIWVADVNFTLVDTNVGNDLGTSEWATLPILKWEERFLNVTKNESKHAENMSLFYYAGRSFSDISGSTMIQSMPILSIGVFLMVVYIQCAISKFNCIDARVMLSACGLLGIGLSLVVTCGICSLCGVFYGPVHTSLPFLIMGLGVDDMFVMTASWNHIANEHSRSPLHERIGYMLRHAGVSITITSLTDFIAFSVGSSTILPSLRSFCIYAGVGVVTTFIFVVTFFTACFTLDQKRSEEFRNGIVPCYKHQPYEKNEFSQRQIVKKSLHFFYDKILLSIPGKIFVILTAIAMSSVGIYGTLQLRQEFDPVWFTPSHTYLYKFIAKRKEFYPALGFDASVLIGKLNYTAEFPVLKSFVADFRNQTDILKVTDSWLEPFQEYVRKNFKKDMDEETLSDYEWNLYLSKFLFSPRGGKYQANFKFKKDLVCGSPASEILVSTISFTFHIFKGPEEHLPAMRQVYKMAKSVNVTTGDKFVTVWSKIFASWLTDEVIDTELIRNLMLALLCVMVCTTILIANLQICLWIFTCVLLTVISVCGWMHIWGLTIDIVSCICLTLAVGLCVDYAAHIGYTFITIGGESRRERALKTVTSIGSAVMHGGLSTLLAMSMLSQSEAYTFQAFFKIFLLVVLFGQYYGVVFLPVMLSIIGPKSRQTHQSVQQIEL